MDAVHAARGEQVSNVHRLNADTRGVLRCAQTLDSLRHLTAQFESLTVEKRYLAIVAGYPPMPNDSP
jgi:23S rRNA-/tRNA-specific pseudouridylate synthase